MNGPYGQLFDITIEPFILPGSDEVVGRSSGSNKNKVERVELFGDGRNRFGQFVVRKTVGNQNEMNSELIGRYNERAKKEFEILLNNRHINLVKVFAGSLELSDPNCPVNQHKLPRFYMQLADCSLRFIIRRTDWFPTDSSYTLDHAKSWLLQAATALAFLHSKDIVHRDVKALNMLLFRNGTKLKLCDLELGRGCEVNMTADRGTDLWMAPEVKTAVARIDDRDLACYGYPADCYSLARVMLELMMRDLPKDGEPDWTDCKFPLDVSVELQLLQAKAMSPLPEARPTAADICSRLRELDAAESAPELLRAPVAVEEVSDTGAVLPESCVTVPRDAASVVSEQVFSLTYRGVPLSTEEIGSVLRELNESATEILNCLKVGSGCQLNTLRVFVRFDLLQPPAADRIALRLYRSGDDNFAADAALNNFLSGDMLVSLLVGKLAIPLYCRHRMGSGDLVMRPVR